MQLDLNKPYMGELEGAERVDFPEGYLYYGTFKGHPKFHDKFGHTSLVVREYEDTIETLNSRYTIRSRKCEKQEHTGVTGEV